MITNKMLVLFLLCTVLPTICMNPTPTPEVLRVLGQCHKARDLLRIASVHDATQFIGKAIACRKDRGIEDSETKIYYGFLERYRAFPIPLGGRRITYFLGLYCAKDGSCNHGISDQTLERQNWFMRFLTLDEVRCLSSAIKEKTISPDSPINGQFTLDNLLPEEQINYFRKQAYKNEWQRLRLLLIGQRDPESPLHLLPKDLIRSLMRSMVEGQVQQLRNNAKLGDVLEL